MITTSYNAPYKDTKVPLDPHTGLQNIEGAFKPLLSSPYVDIWAPQLYTGLFQTSRVDVTFSDWTQLIHPGAEIIPMIMVYAPRIKALGGSVDGAFQHQIDKFEFKCQEYPAQFKRFCDAGKYYIWSGSV